MTASTQDRIVKALARAVALRLSRRAVVRLQKMRHTLSGDDSELKTTWDEICAQVQGDESQLWDAYESAMTDALVWDVLQLPIYEKQAIWLQSPEGEDWDCQDDERKSDEPPVSDDDIVRHLVQEYVLAEAGRWSNPRIRAFLDRASMWD
jgi:hypothetical protein